MENYEIALDALKKGNEKFVGRDGFDCNASKAKRKSLESGQKPYAVIVACSDSRVIPEAIFSADLGDLFVIRVAGNVIGEAEMGSVEYAVNHLGASLVAVLGHTSCGAVHAAVCGHAEGRVSYNVNKISEAIGSETDERTASIKNAAHAAEVLRRSCDIPGAKVVHALYDTVTGQAEFFL